MSRRLSKKKLGRARNAPLTAELKMELRRALALRRAGDISFAECAHAVSELTKHLRPDAPVSLSDASL